MKQESKPAFFRTRIKQLHNTAWSLIIFAALLLAGCNGDAVQFSDKEKALITSLKLAESKKTPLRASNRFAYDKNAIEFGKRLFFDKSLSNGKSVACSSCHIPDKKFTDGLVVGKGLGQLTRNTPTVIGLGGFTWFYWDGRKDSLWSQALAPLEAPQEMGNGRVGVLQSIAENPEHLRLYEKIFGRFPLWISNSGLPSLASPLTSGPAKTAWQKLSVQNKDEINRAFSNIGKAIAAYEISLDYQPSRFDRFVQHNLNASPLKKYLPLPKDSTSSLSQQELMGLKLFIDEKKSQCIRCHNGTQLSNGDFHNIGSGGAFNRQPDFGRFIGLQSVMIDPFNCQGRYSDARKNDCTALRFINKSIDGNMMGAFKAPSLRNLEHTAPYFHDGRFTTLEQVVRHYETLPPHAEVEPIQLTDQERKQLIAFLKTLSA